MPLLFQLLRIEWGSLDPNMVTFLNVVVTICFVILVLSSVVMIVSIMLDPSTVQQGGNILTGAINESYYGKNKGKNTEGRIKRIVVVCAFLILLSSIGLVLLIEM
ncbi:MAG: preprotein translocase subunit SecG [Firmicutes bacterium]|nr:preprotein translocase subunit SecG [Bacillota bacterium]MCL2771138.1 preprotein translocase subunit SecG [Bacillota bacterium]